MDSQAFHLVEIELSHAGETSGLTPEMLLLEELRITPEKELPTMDFLFRLFGVFGLFGVFFLVHPFRLVDINAFVHGSALLSAGRSIRRNLSYHQINDYVNMFIDKYIKYTKIRTHIFSILI